MVELLFDFGFLVFDVTTKDIGALGRRGRCNFVVLAVDHRLCATSQRAYG